MNLANVLFVGILILFPFAIYFLVLAYINYRRTPMMVSGVWDGAGLLFATSGFLLLGGPLILSGFRSGFQDWISGSLRNLFGFDGPLWPLWLAFWLAYVFGLLAIAGSILLRRRHVTIIYNVEPAMLDLALAHVLNKLGLAWTRHVNRIGLAPAPKEGPAKAPAAQETAITTTPAQPAAPAIPLAGVLLTAQSLLEIDPFPGMRNVTLRWHADGNGLRRDVEGELARMLMQIQTTDNPAANWFLSLAGMLFALMLFSMILTILFTLPTRY